MTASSHPNPAGAAGVHAQIDHARALMESGALAEAEAAVRQYLQKQPKQFALVNLLGVILRRQRRYAESITCLLQAQKLSNASIMATVNLGNVYLDMKEGKKAEAMFLKAARTEPKNQEHVHQLAKAQRMQGDTVKALATLRRALMLNSQNTAIIYEMVRMLLQLERYDEALQEIDSRLAHMPGNAALLSAKADVYKSTGQMQQAVATLESVVRTNPENVDVWLNLASIHAMRDRKTANVYFRRAVEADKRSLRTLGLLCNSLNLSRYENEAAHIQEAYEIACEMVDTYPAHALVPHIKYLKSIFLRCCDDARYGKLGDPARYREFWLQTEEIGAFHYELSRVRTLEDRLDMIRYHREWGKQVEARAAAHPITHQPRAVRSKIRVGFMSSDLRSHPVTYFTLPLLEHYDRERFEVYCYSFYTGAADSVQQHIERTVDCFRWWPGKSDHAVAQEMANDQLDILFELGGTTYMNKLQVLAYRPAPVQVSWLGYPHSSGLSTADYILVDPYLKPDDARLLIEKPFELPESWVSISRFGFRDVAIIPETPESRTGMLTFGTMNNPYKYTPELIETWAKIMQRVPHSRFLFVRPEGDVPAFREQIESAFERHGIARSRIHYTAVRGQHMAHYNDIDIALDSFPHVGGTTTCETIWMGVPVVSLVGPAFFERLSYSNLSNAGLGDLCVFTPEDYIEKAVALAADAPRRAHFRQHVREQLKTLPLGQPERFSQHFYAKIEEVIR